MRNLKNIYDSSCKMTDVIIASVSDTKEDGYVETYWRVIDCTGDVLGSWGELADAESYCNDTNLTYEIVPVRKYTANLLGSLASLHLCCIEDSALNTTFYMAVKDVEKVRQNIRDYCAKNRIKILNRASFNWPI